MDPNIPVKVEQTDAPAVKKKEKGMMITIGVTLVVLIVMAVIGFLFMKPAPDFVQGQGGAPEIRISGQLPGRVAELYVQEGQEVHAGDTLVHIHSSLVDARLAQAEAMENVAKATDRKVDAGTRSQIVTSAEEVWKQAQAASGIAKKTFDRLDNLFKEGVVTEQKRDEAKAAYEAALAGERAAKSQYELAKSGAQKEDKDAAASMVKASRAGVNEVNAIREDQYLLAPCDGVITVIYPEESELVALGAPIMTLQKADRWAVFNVRETMLNGMKVGDNIKVKIPALGDNEYTMKIFYIKDMGTYANWQATKATGDFDARTFEVKARPEKPIEGFLPGMSVVLLQ